MSQKKLILVCEQCLARNYKFLAPKNHIKRLMLNKYCSTCHKVQVHKETR